MACMALVTPAPSVDFRTGKRDSALARAVRLEEAAARGGTDWYVSDQCLLSAARARSFAAWVQSKIDAYPPGTPGM